MSRRRRADADFITADSDDDGDEDLLGEGEDAADYSDDAEGGAPSTSARSNRPQRDRRAPARLEDIIGGTSGGNPQHKASRAKGKGRADAVKGRTWEGDIQRSWDIVQEDERGTLEGAVSGALLSSKTRR